MNSSIEDIVAVIPVPQRSPPTIPMEQNVSTNTTFEYIHASPTRADGQDHLSESMILSLSINIPMAIMILIGNGLVLLLFIKKARLLDNTSNRILLNLTVADFSTGFMMLLHIVAQFVYRLYMPRDSLGYSYRVVVDIITACLQNVSITNLCLVVLERYVCLLHPYQVTKILTRTRIRLYIIIAWFISFAVPCVQFVWLSRTFDGQISEEDENILTRSELHYDIASMVLFALVPVVWQMFAFVRMGFSVRQIPSVNLLLKKREDMRVLLVFATMFVLFLLFCVPYHVARLLIDLGLFRDDRKLIVVLSDVVYTMKHVTPLADPFVYTFYKPDIAREYRRTSRKLSNALRSSFSRKPAEYKLQQRDSVATHILSKGQNVVQLSEDGKQSLMGEMHFL